MTTIAAKRAAGNDEGLTATNIQAENPEVGALFGIPDLLKTILIERLSPDWPKTHRPSQSIME